MRLNFPVCNFGELRLMEDFAAENPDKVMLNKVEKETGPDGEKKYHYSLKTTDDALLKELNRRMKNLRSDQELLSKTYAIKAHRKKPR
jgi:hypothetical protein